MTFLVSSTSKRTSPVGWSYMKLTMLSMKFKMKVIVPFSFSAKVTYPRSIELPEPSISRGQRAIRATPKVSPFIVTVPSRSTIGMLDTWPFSTGYRLAVAWISSPMVISPLIWTPELLSLSSLILSVKSVTFTSGTFSTAGARTAIALLIAVCDML